MSKPTYCRVVTDPRDATQDYWLTREQVDTFKLPVVHVYASEQTWYDPTRRFVWCRVRNMR